ncbi:MAG: hypothetical protein JJU28_24760 [Cyclobacteriaceae bacterium]|nr:hypothetical protein [Cyclobacteriaceae bacterium]
MNNFYFKLSKWQQIILISGLIFCLYYSWFYYKSLVHSRNLLELEYHIENLNEEKGKIKSHYTSRKSLALEEALKHTIALDSLSIWLDTRQSIIKLQLQGLTVYTAKIQSLEISPTLETINPEYLLEICRNPIRINRIISLTKKEPAKLIKAPGIGAQETSTIDTMKTENINSSALTYSFQLDNGIILSINSYEKSLLEQLVQPFANNGSTFIHRIDAMAHFSWEKIPATIKIELNKQAAEIIFRAVPYNGFVIIDASR